MANFMLVIFIVIVIVIVTCCRSSGVKLPAGDQLSRHGPELLLRRVADLLPDLIVVLHLVVVARVSGHPDRNLRSSKNTLE